LPEGNYVLVEARGKPVHASLGQLSIKGDRLSLTTPLDIFEGSVRDRFTGSVKQKPRPDPMDWSKLPDGPWYAESIRKLIENSTWKEEDGKLRLVQNGQTVMRFELARVEADKAAQ